MVPDNYLPLETHAENKETRWVIFTKALELFSTRGVEAVSMRNLADAVGIQAGTIYAHFPSKEHLVEAMYLYYDQAMSALDAYRAELLAGAELDDPKVFLERCIIDIPLADNLYVTQILHIAMARMRCDDRARDLIERRFRGDFDLLRNVLHRMCEQGKLKPVDVDVYVDIYQHLCFSASYHLDTTLHIPFDRWQAMNRLFFSFILPE